MYEEIRDWEVVTIERISDVMAELSGSE
ncbi:competence regulator inhibitor paratox [Streptococcus pyogenes]